MGDSERALHPSTHLESHAINGESIETWCEALCIMLLMGGSPTPSMSLQSCVSPILAKHSSLPSPTRNSSARRKREGWRGVWEHLVSKLVGRGGISGRSERESQFLTNCTPRACRATLTHLDTSTHPRTGASAPAVEMKADSSTKLAEAALRAGLPATGWLAVEQRIEQRIKPARVKSAG